MAASIGINVTAAACLVLIMTVVAAAGPKISCGTVTSTLAPCFGYILAGGVVPDNCCSGVKSLYKTARTTADLRAVCFCLKSLTSSASPAAINNAKTLPGKCGLSLPYQITPAIDCNK
ncbi:hypothetical protein RD792_013871 [Penstemon davidsonii]|uniref:Non-specific lipid-transfer protein n=1 Tax=Penstemon davidsonii TaxID=160366 RepID=A0ABR0CMY4_9LAMI|nr:hypothetical protein RD792_013871 [Penstemon davidsonii]